MADVLISLRKKSSNIEKGDKEDCRMQYATLVLMLLPVQAQSHKTCVYIWKQAIQMSSQLDPTVHNYGLCFNECTEISRVGITARVLKINFMIKIKNHCLNIYLGLINLYYHSPKYSNSSNSITNKLLVIKFLNKFKYIKLCSYANKRRNKKKQLFK